MRLIVLYNICKEELSTFKGYELTFETLLKEKRYRTFNSEFKKFFTFIYSKYSNIPYFTEILSEINELSHDDYNDDEKFASIRFQEFCNFCKKVDNVILLYETMVKPDMESNGLNIKIPKTDNITELKKYIDDLEFVITKCPFLQSSKESLKLQAVDNGSIWLIFGVIGISVTTGSVLLNNIAAFIDKCFVIRSHKLACDTQKQIIENSEMEQKEKEELLKNITKVYRIGVQNVIKELEVSTGHKINDGDERGRAEQAIGKMERLLDKGLQIYSALNAPKEANALFEPLKMHYLEIEKSLELIEEKGDKNTG